MALDIQYPNSFIDGLLSNREFSAAKNSDFILILAKTFEPENWLISICK